MTVGKAATSTRPCVACLGTTRCWVCDGVGRIRRRDGNEPCARCLGMGVCRDCGYVPAQRSKTV
jgi:hypothetical protein